MAKIEVYPNPASGVINFSSQKEHQLLVKIYDSLGRTAYTKKSQSTEWPMSLNLTPGLYIMTLSNKSIQQCEKILIQ